MESIEHQEWRARHHLSWSAILKIGLGLGLYLFIFPGGTPWTGGGVANGVLGRSLTWPWAAIAFTHFALCMLYMVVIALAIYRLRLIPAVIVGLVIALALYGVTYLIFATGNAGDGRSLAAHIVFGLFSAVLYKAISVPPPLRDAGREKSTGGGLGQS
jgi:hypothetical protein